MDYKEAIDVLSWVARNAKLSGSDARVYVLMVTTANYKTAEFSASYDDMATVLRTTKQNIMISVKRLEKVGFIKKIEAPVGRSNSVYKIRSREDLATIHERDDSNPEHIAWMKAYDNLFYEFDSELLSIGSNCEACKEDENEEFILCPYHRDEEKRLLDTKKGRERKLWLSDNKKPESKIKIVPIIDLSKE